MADKPTATAEPAPGATPGAGDAGRRVDPDPNDAVVAGAASAFEGDDGAVPLGGPKQPEPTEREAGDEPAKVEGETGGSAGIYPPEAGKADATTGEKTAVEPLPFDEALAGLTPIESADRAAAFEQLAKLDKPEEVAKAINPTGTASEAEQLKHAQQLIGRFSSSVAQARQLAAAIEPFVIKDDNGEPAGLDLLAMAEQLGPEALSDQLAAAGKKIVPLDWGAEHAALDRDYPADIVNKLVPDATLTFEEKVELIKSDPEKLVDLRVAKREREVLASRNVERQAEADAAAVTARVKEIAAGDKAFAALKPYMTAWNNRLPESFTGALRADVCYRLAKLDRLLSPEFRKAQSDAIYKRAEQDLMKKLKLTVPVGGGGAHVRAPAKSSEEFAPLAGAVEAFG